MSLSLHILKASGRLNPFFEQIKNIISEGEKQITTVLPFKDVDMVVVDDSYRVIPEIGIGGHTYSPAYIIITLDPTFPDFKNTLQKELLDTVAHELHHAARWQTVGYGETLLQTMISEGLADHFAMEITKRKNIPLWDKALSKEQSKLFAQKAVGEYSNTNYKNNNDWLFGSKKRGIARWTAYTLGFQLVGVYLKNHPDAKASTLYNLPAEEFIK